MAKFKKGSLVRYTGEDKVLRSKVFIGKDTVIYQLSTGKSDKIEVSINETLLKAEKTKKEISISEVDKRAKQIRKQSGIAKVERVTFYNMSLKEAKKQAFQELKNK
jgi:hypothetical protein